MKEIIITTQEQLDKITRIEKDEFVIIKKSLRLNIILNVFGKLRLETSLDCNRWDLRYVVAWENSSVVAWGNSSVVARGNSSVVARGNSSVEARENSSVVAWGNSSVVARENSSVEAWGNSSVEAWGNCVVRAFSAFCKTVLHGFSVFFMPINISAEFEIKSTHVHVQRPEPLDWFENNAIEKKEKIILYKKVSKDFQTQEGTKNETTWKIGSTVEHPNWQPEKEECGGGKYHACSRPYFCDEFRNIKGDRYVAIEILKNDLYEWKDSPCYPHKIGFKACKVLFECNKIGIKI